MTAYQNTDVRMIVVVVIVVVVVVVVVVVRDSVHSGDCVQETHV